jgi:hypothetical protein
MLNLNAKDKNIILKDALREASFIVDDNGKFPLHSLLEEWNYFGCVNKIYIDCDNVCRKYFLIKEIKFKPRTYFLSFYIDKSLIYEYESVNLSKITKMIEDIYSLYVFI